MTHHPARNRASRRQFLGSAPLIGLGSLLLIKPALAQQDHVLKDSDSEAVAIDYHSDASAVNVSKFPKYAKGQNCRTCSLYVEDTGAATGACGIVFGKLVEAKGWCSSWEKKPG
jgi:hypothetical protein